MKNIIDKNNEKINQKESFDDELTSKEKLQIMLEKFVPKSKNLDDLINKAKDFLNKNKDDFIDAVNFLDVFEDEKEYELDEKKKEKFLEIVNKNKELNELTILLLQENKIPKEYLGKSLGLVDRLKFGKNKQVRIKEIIKEVKNEQEVLKKEVELFYKDLFDSFLEIVDTFRSKLLSGVYNKNDFVSKEKKQNFFQNNALDVLQTFKDDILKYIHFKKEVLSFVKFQEQKLKDNNDMLDIYKTSKSNYTFSNTNIFDNYRLRDLQEVLQKDKNYELNIKKFYTKALKDLGEETIVLYFKKIINYVNNFGNLDPLNICEMDYSYVNKEQLKDSKEIKKELDSFIEVLKEKQLIYNNSINDINQIQDIDLDKCFEKNVDRVLKSSETILNKVVSHVTLPETLKSILKEGYLFSQKAYLDEKGEGVFNSLAGRKHIENGQAMPDISFSIDDVEAMYSKKEAKRGSVNEKYNDVVGILFKYGDVVEGKEFFNSINTQGRLPSELHVFNRDANKGSKVDINKGIVFLPEEQKDDWLKFFKELDKEDNNLNKNFIEKNIMFYPQDMNLGMVIDNFKNKMKNNVKKGILIPTNKERCSGVLDNKVLKYQPLV